MVDVMITKPNQDQPKGTVTVCIPGRKPNGARNEKPILMWQPARVAVARARDIIRDRTAPVERSLVVEDNTLDAIRVAEESGKVVETLASCGLYPDATLGERWYRFTAAPPIVKAVVAEVPANVEKVVEPTEEEPAVTISVEVKPPLESEIKPVAPNPASKSPAKKK